MTEFGKRLKNLRKDRGLTQNELAKALKVSRSSIEMYEHGKREPDFETQEAIADFFNVNLDYLRGRSDRNALTIDVVDAPEIVELYEKFIELCKRRNKSQTEVLKELNISPSNAANWKNRGGSVRSDVLIKLADYFDVSVDWLLGRYTKKENTIDNGITLDLFKNDHLFYMNTMKLFNLPLEYRHVIYDQIDYQSFRYLNDTKKKDASSTG